MNRSTLIEGTDAAETESPQYMADENRILSLLYVDDSSDDLVLFKKAWERTRVRFAWTEASTVADAQDYLNGLVKESKVQSVIWPTLIMSDIALPIASGFDVVRFVRGIPALRRVPVILLSDWLSWDDIVESQKVGADRCLLKPCDLDGLVGIARDLRRLVTGATGMHER